MRGEGICRTNVKLLPTRLTCCQLSSTKVDAHGVINWSVVGQLTMATVDC